MFFFVSYTHSPTKKCTSSLDKECLLEINSCIYRISGIVYLKSHHYWCEVYSTQTNCKNGWFVHNGLWNNGKATFVGLFRPLFLEKESLHLLMFEKVMTKSASTTVSTTFYKQIHSNNIDIVKDIIHNHKKLLSLPDNKVKLDNIRAILLHHNISIPPNMKVADLKYLLLRHCNTTMTMPITFVSDGSIENYTVAPDREFSLKHEQTICVHDVPVTFINDSMINLVKIEANRDENYFPTETFKRLDLTPNKQGYTPERHPTKKQKVGIEIQSLDANTCNTSYKHERLTCNLSDTDSDDFDQTFKPLHNKEEQTPEMHPKKRQKVETIKQSNDPDSTSWTNKSQHPESKSFKEMINAIHNSNISASYCEDDFVQSFEPINTDLHFDTLDEPTESEKQSVQAKYFLSDSFDYSHEFQMVKTQDLWDYKEFDRSVMLKSGNNHDHLDQVRRFILKNGFEEPIIISCDLQDGKAYITEGNHRLWVALKEGIPFIPCRVIPHWLPPHGSYKNLDIDVANLKAKKVILPEHLGFTVA